MSMDDRPSNLDPKQTISDVTLENEAVLVKCPNCNSSFYVRKEIVSESNLCPICNKVVLFQVVNKDGNA